MRLSITVEIHEIFSLTILLFSHESKKITSTTGSTWSKFQELDSYRKVIFFSLFLLTQRNSHISWMQDFFYDTARAGESRFGALVRQIGRELPD